MIEVVYAHIADYATDSTHGKMTIVRIFDRIYVSAGTAFEMPISFLAMKLQASLMDGSEGHVLELVDGNQQPANDENHQLPLRFGTTGPGEPLASQMILQLAGFPMPGVGDWMFELRVDGRVVRNVPCTVLLSPSA